MTKLPNKAKVVIIGGGIHGLSTAWKLSETYKNPGDIIVLEKEDIAAGASGIACGVVRNNYFQPAMRELMAHSVSVWESDPKLLNIMLLVIYKFHQKLCMKMFQQFMNNKKLLVTNQNLSKVKKIVQIT